MKTYKITFFEGIDRYIFNGIRFNFRGYSKADLIEALWGYGYLDEDELARLDKITNAWTIEEEAE